MANVKATDIVIIREMFKEKGDQDMNALASVLKPETFKILKTSLSINWVPLEIEAEILRKRPDCFFPTIRGLYLNWDIQWQVNSLPAFTSSFSGFQVSALSSRMLQQHGIP